MYVIIGASSGLGKALAEHLDGWVEFVGTSRIQTDELDGLDPCDEASVKRFASMFDDDGEYAVDIDRDEINLIHCVGLTKSAKTQNMSTEVWDEVVDVNLKSAFLISKYFIPIMRQTGGRIIFCGSVCPRIGVVGTPAYSAAKAGLIGLMKTIAVENAKYGITCNVLELGYFDSGMGAKLPEPIKDEVVKKIPCGRFGDPSEFISAVEFLVDNEYVNGAVIPVTGGL